jgi:hypothetical protein
MTACVSPLSQLLTDLSIAGDADAVRWKANDKLRTILTHLPTQEEVKKIFKNRWPDIEMTFTKIWTNQNILSTLSGGGLLSAAQTAQIQKIQAIFTQSFTRKFAQIACENTIKAIVTQLQLGQARLHEMDISREGVRDEELQRAEALIGDYGRNARCWQYLAPQVVIWPTQDAATQFCMGQIAPNVLVSLHDLLKDSKEFDTEKVFNAICNAFTKYQITVQLHLDFKLNGDMYEKSFVRIRAIERQSLRQPDSFWED